MGAYQGVTSRSGRSNQGRMVGFLQQKCSPAVGLPPSALRAIIKRWVRAILRGSLKKGVSWDYCYPVQPPPKIALPKPCEIYFLIAAMNTIFFRSLKALLIEVSIKRDESDVLHYNTFLARNLGRHPCPFFRLKSAFFGTLLPLSAHFVR